MAVPDFPLLPAIFQTDQQLLKKKTFITEILLMIAVSVKLTDEHVSYEYFLIKVTLHWYLNDCNVNLQN